MIPHIIQERSVEQDIHHTGEAAPRTPIHGGEEPRRRTSRLWLQSKTCIPPPRGGEKAKLLHQWRLQTWTSVCPRRGCPCKSTLGPLQPPHPPPRPTQPFFLSFLFKLLLLWLYGLDLFLPLFCVGVWILFPECKHFPPAGSPHVDTLLYESEVCLFFFPPVVMHFQNVSNNLFISFENINISKRQILLRNTNMNWLSCIILTAYKTNKTTHIIIVIINSNSINKNSHLGQQW